jgi:hypothetical protein
MKYTNIGEAMSRILLVCSFASLLEACGTLSVQDDGMEKARLACADVGIEPGTAVFGQCVFDLYQSLWDRENSCGM